MKNKHGNQHIANIVKMARGDRTQQQFATIIKKNRADVAKYENMLASPTAPTLMKVLKTMAVFRNGKACLPSEIFDGF